MSRALADFQDDFVRALYGADALPADIAALTAQPGFAVYRNTVVKCCVDALAANYPTVARLVGADWFRAAALIHVRTAAPTDVSLLEYGADFADFLERFAPAQQLPYLADVARLDRCWTEAHCAGDDATLEAGAIAGLDPVVLGQTILRPHAAARWAWFPAMPVYTIWSVNRALGETGDDLAWRGEGALLTRRAGGVGWQALDAGASAFLDACAAGLPLQQAIAGALLIEPSLDIARMLADLIGAGAFGAAICIQPQPADQE